MEVNTARAEAQPRSWASRLVDWRVWAHAGLAVVVGAVFSVLVRNLGIAGVVGGGGFLWAAVLAVLASGLAFGALGRIFTQRRAGWWLVATLVLWLPAIVAVAFLVFTDTGSFDRISIFVPLVGGLVAAVCALLGWAGPPRWIALLLLVVTAIIVVTVAFR
jgi:hypothetical protein